MSSAPMSATQIEYTYSTDPDWVGDAVVCTDTGVELNFEKLNEICGGGLLPGRITIVLAGSDLVSGTSASTPGRPCQIRLSISLPMCLISILTIVAAIRQSMINY